jgi:hypothetical protein
MCLHDVRAQEIKIYHVKWSGKYFSVTTNILNICWKAEIQKASAVKH